MKVLLAFFIALAMLMGLAVLGAIIALIVMLPGPTGVIVFLFLILWILAYVIVKSKE